MNRLIIVSGPSCVGKSPLYHALVRHYPDLARDLGCPITFTSRRPRPGERDGEDFHFRSREFIAGLKKEKEYIVLEVRGDLQALHLPELTGLLETSDVLFEGNAIVGSLLLSHPGLKKIPKVSLFLSPLSREEILFLKAQPNAPDLSNFVTSVMRKKLLRRTTKQQGILSLPDLENIEKRAASAFPEMQEAHRFDWVVPNHDGEESDHWEAFYYPIGEARKTLFSLVFLLQGNPPAFAEKWETELLR